MRVAHEREFTKQLMQQHGFTQQGWIEEARPPKLG